jgi:RNA polymerase sigma-70 factor (ECF subfamily)
VEDDPALVEAWRGGDRGAAERLIERHYDSIVAFFRTKAGSHADDLVQRTFLRCTERVATYRGEGGFRAFLFGIARNVLFEHLRGRVRDGVAPDVNTSSIFELVPGAATLLGQDAERRLLIAALQRIPVDLQLALELYYWEELSIDELAEVLEVPPGTVKSRLHRARTLLREAMEAVPASPFERAGLRDRIAAWITEPDPAVAGEDEGG